MTPDEPRSRERRLSFVVRRNAGRRGLPALRGLLTERLGRAVVDADLLPLEAGDALWEHVVPALRACWQQGPPAFSRWAPRDLPSLSDGLGRLDVGTRRVVYLPPPGTGIGPIRVSPIEMVPHVLAFATDAGEQCTITTEDGAGGLRLDYQANEHERGSPCPCELAIWGAAWQRAARRVLPFDLAHPDG